MGTRFITLADDTSMATMEKLIQFHIFQDADVDSGTEPFRHYYYSKSSIFVFSTVGVLRSTLYSATGGVE